MLDNSYGGSDNQQKLRQDFFGDLCGQIWWFIKLFTEILVVKFIAIARSPSIESSIVFGEQLPKPDQLVWKLDFNWKRAFTHLRDLKKSINYFMLFTYWLFLWMHKLWFTFSFGVRFLTNLSCVSFCLS